ncbi:hypothetical protein K501DRAFT_265673 [Backusella circina FSU 941]|nr:hypothetical protein K501DRAFT_265673 [Backusella circina FSU 941]
MTHLSIWHSDRFRCLKPSALIAGELKSIITVLLMIMIAMQFMWDIASSYVKYNEGFVPYGGNYISKPFSYWTPAHQKLVVAMDYVECVTFSLQIGIFLLMQSFWNYLSNTVAKKSFMSSFEFKFYIVWALASMAMFPILQWVYRNDVYLREAIPQFAYGLEAIINAVLGIRTHMRFRRIIALTQRNSTAGIIMFMYGSSMTILCADGLTEAKIINSSKFGTDTIIANINICTVFLLLSLIGIFHPRPQYFKAEATSTTNESNFQYSTANRNPTNYIVNDSAINETMSSEKVMMGDTKSNNRGFMRAMSPITVDYPHSLTNDTVSLTANAAINRPLSPSSSQGYYSKKSRNLTIEDPYNNEPVMFSMMDAGAKRYASPSSPTSNSNRNDIPMHGMRPNRMNTMSPQHRYTDEDDYFDTNPNSSYYVEQDRVVSPQKNRRPSWEQKEDFEDMVPQSTGGHPNQPGNQMVRDWLWQSPDRRNP